MTGIPLFIAENTGRCMLQLRRFQHGTASGEHYHNACATIDEDAEAVLRKPDGTRFVTHSDPRAPHDDRRWPGACECGYRFAAEDEWQVNEVEWFAGAGQRFAWGIANWDGPPGAMIRSPWRDQPGRPPAYTVFLPNRAYWNTNDRAAGEGSAFGPYWTVTGEAPRITVHPSIDDRNPARPWHGWIRDGRLVPA